MPIRAEALPAAEVIRSATIIGAEVAGVADRLGQVSEGFLAGPLVVGGESLSDLLAPRDQGARIAMLPKGGVAAKDRLAA